MTAIELIDALQTTVTRQRQRLEATVSLMEGHRWSEVEQMIYTSISDAAATEKALREIRDRVHQLDLFA